MTRKSLAQAISATALLVACGLVSCAAVKYDKPAGEPSVVKVINPDGHGSGVYIGGDRFLTAYHVVVGSGTSPADTVKIKTQGGEEFEADVVWNSKKYDVALLRSTAHPKMRAAELACRNPVEGEVIEAVGNPLEREWIHKWGRVASSGVIKTDAGTAEWIGDIEVLPGMSGGPVFDSSGAVLGLNDAVEMVKTSMFSANFVPLSFFVPSVVICSMMGN